eukprot:11227660-Lingulodinium_polyedra.AAC.1
MRRAVRAGPPRAEGIAAIAESMARSQHGGEEPGIVKARLPPMVRMDGPGRIVRPAKGHIQ